MGRRDHRAVRGWPQRGAAGSEEADAHPEPCGFIRTSHMYLVVVQNVEAAFSFAEKPTAGTPRHPLCPSSEPSARTPRADALYLPAPLRNAH